MAGKCRTAEGLATKDRLFLSKHMTTLGIRCTCALKVMDLRRIIGELQRRHVGRVAGVYAVGGWVLIQVAATVFPLLGAPEWLPRLTVTLVIAGFPLAIILAWVFDFTPAGIQRTEALPEDVPISVPTSRSTYARSLGFFGVGILVALATF